MKPTTKYILFGIGALILISAYRKRRLIMNYVISAQNEPFIATLHPAVKNKFIELFAKAEKLGWKFYITNSLRIQSKNSMHQLGLAIDCNLVNIKTGETITMKNHTIKQWEATGIPQLAESLGFTWGGRFLNYTNMYGAKGDAVHFEYNFGKTYQQLVDAGVKQFGTKDLALKNYEQINLA